MLQKKFRCLFSLALVVLLMTNTVSNAATRVTLLSEYNMPITQSSPYISSTFVPQTNRINYHYTMISTKQYTSTYYVERYSNGSWIVEDSDTLNGLQGISTGLAVKSNSTYRIRAISTDPYARRVNCEVTEDR